MHELPELQLSGSTECEVGMNVFTYSLTLFCLFCLNNSIDSVLLLLPLLFLLYYLKNSHFLLDFLTKDEMKSILVHKKLPHHRIITYRSSSALLLYSSLGFSRDIRPWPHILTIIHHPLILDFLRFWLTPSYLTLVDFFFLLPVFFFFLL